MKKIIHHYIPGWGEYPYENDAVSCGIDQIAYTSGVDTNWGNVTCKRCLKSSLSPSDNNQKLV